MRFCAAIHLTSSDTIRDSRGSIENKETPRGDGNSILSYLFIYKPSIENKETPRGDGNSIYFSTTVAICIENKETPRGGGCRLFVRLV